MDYNQVYLGGTMRHLEEYFPQVVVQIVMGYLSNFSSPITFTDEEDWLDSLIYYEDEYSYYGWKRYHEKIRRSYSFQPEAITRMNLMDTIKCNFISGTTKDRLILGYIGIKTGNKRWMLAMVDYIDEKSELFYRLPVQFQDLVKRKVSIYGGGLRMVDIFCSEYLSDSDY
jgi:hypothetical protein